jgi:hypothetical protein
MERKPSMAGDATNGLERKEYVVKRLQEMGRVEP